MSEIRQAGTGTTFMYLGFVQEFDGYPDRRGEFAHGGRIWALRTAKRGRRNDVETIPISGGLAVLTESPEIKYRKA
jgi:hypothetical protein